MCKRALVLFLVLILFISGCQGTPDKSADITPQPTTAEPTPVKEEKVTAYAVPNQSGVFSSKDLIYFVMTDRFYDGDTANNQFSDVDKNNPKAYHGGDLKGVTKKLDYIKSLGATAIWLTPVVQNEEYGYHGYWTRDFYKVDPHLGTMEDLKNLVDEAHAKGIKVILDYVVNHTGYNSPWLKDSTKDNWFHPRKDISNWNDPEQLEKGWIYGLPDLDQSNPEVKAFLIENALWWIEQTNIDGMRLDTVKHVSKSFWNEFAYSIKVKYPDFYLLGEVWDENPTYLEQFHALGIDGLTDYPLYKGIKTAFTRFGKVNTLINAINQRKTYTNPELNAIFIDNHDNKRHITSAGENGAEYLKQALTFIMTYPSIPTIYYGTELGMEGGDDPDNRRDMEWEKVKNSDMLKFYKTLADLRSKPVVSDGSFELLDYDNYFFSYMRQKDNNSLIVVYNVQNKEKAVTINLPASNVKYKNILTNKTYTAADNKLEVTLQPLEILLLESK